MAALRPMRGQLVRWSVVAVSGGRWGCVIVVPAWGRSGSPGRALHRRLWREGMLAFATVPRAVSAPGLARAVAVLSVTVVLSPPARCVLRRSPSVRYGGTQSV